MGPNSLGHIVGNGTVSPADCKVQAVRAFPQPRTKKQVRQFLGLTGFGVSWISMLNILFILPRLLESPRLNVLFGVMLCMMSIII